MQGAQPAHLGSGAARRKRSIGPEARSLRLALSWAAAAAPKRKSLCGAYAEPMRSLCGACAGGRACARFCWFVLVARVKRKGWDGPCWAWAGQGTSTRLSAP